MVLETLHKDAPQNIKGLVLENPEPAPRLSFDPIRDISPQIWDQVIKDSSIDSPFFLSLVILLNPAFRQRFSQKDFQTAETIAKARIYRNIALRDLETVSNLKIINPSAAQKVLDELLTRETFRFWQEGFDDLKPEIEDPDVGILNALALAKLCYPGEVKEIKPEDFDPDLFRSPAIQKLKSKNHSDFISIATSLTIILSRNPFELTAQDWNLMKSNFYELQSRDRIYDLYSFLKMAYQMTILSAESVNVTENGLELVLKEPDFQHPIPPLPELRRF